MNNLKPRIFMKVKKPSSNTPCDFVSFFPIQLYALYRIYVTYQAFNLMELVFDKTCNPKENLWTQLDKKKCRHTKKKVIKACVSHKHMYHRTSFLNKRSLIYFSKIQIKIIKNKIKDDRSYKSMLNYWNCIGLEQMILFS